MQITSMSLDYAHSYLVGMSNTGNDILSNTGDVYRQLSSLMRIVSNNVHNHIRKLWIL